LTIVTVLVRAKQMALALLVILLTGTENINQNAIIDYFTMEDVFPSLLHVRIVFILLTYLDRRVERFKH
jgi:hypothetical protein